MNTEDKKPFLDYMVNVGKLYGKDQKTIKEIASVYFYSLESYSLEDIQRAINDHVIDTDNGQFMPKPADIVRQINGSKQSNALQAWSKVEKAIRQVGSYKSVCFDDPIIHKTIEDMGGWIDLNMITETELPFKRNEFEKRYQGYCGRNFDFQKSLTGLIEMDVSKEGATFNTKDLVMIGNHENALLTYEKGGEHKTEFSTFRKISELIDFKN